MRLAIFVLTFVTLFAIWRDCKAQSSIPRYSCKSNGLYDPQNCADEDPSACLALFPRSTPSVSAPLGGRNELCFEAALYDIALMTCPNTCYACCLRPEFTCGNSPISPLNCTTNARLCKDTNWTTVMNTYCPGTCGTCLTASCRDINLGCRDNIQLCNDMTFGSYMRERCARTCNLCSSGTITTTTAITPSSICTDVATNCALNRNFCNNSVYQSMMTQKCAKTCGRCSGFSSSTCTDIASNCASNRNFCNNSAYLTIMTQKCARTCGRCSNSIAAATCTDASLNCAAWIRSGFCSNNFYTVAQRRQYCARSCNLC